MGFLGECDVWVDYYHSAADHRTNSADTVEIEAVTVFLEIHDHGLTPVEIDIDMIDESDLATLIEDCSEDVDKKSEAVECQHDDAMERRGA